MKTTEEMIDVMQAFVEGKEIQFYSPSRAVWGDIETPSWSWEDFDYRIKSEEPKYRPFNDIDELVAFWDKHYGNSNRSKATMPLIWVKRTSINYVALIEAFDLEHNKVITSLSCVDLKELCSSFTFLDDKPCGVEE